MILKSLIPGEENPASLPTLTCEPLTCSRVRFDLNDRGEYECYKVSNQAQRESSRQARKKYTTEFTLEACSYGHNWNPVIFRPAIMKYRLVARLQHLQQGSVLI